MNEPTNEPPLVRHVRPRPGFIEAALWCVLFLAAQLFAAVVTVAIVFTAYTLDATDPKKFVDEQLEGFIKAVDAKAEGDRMPMPFEIGQSLAWGMLAAQFASLGVIALVFPRRIGRDWKRQIGVRRPRRLHVLLVLLIVPGFMVVAELIQQLFLRALGLEPASLKYLYGVFGPFPWPLTLLAIAVGPGVVEELWFRGFLGRGLSARYGLVAGVLITSAFFAFVHLSPPQFIVYTLMGAYLHFVYIATRSIWPPILLHALNNGIGIAIMLLLPEKQDQPMPIVASLAAFSLMFFGSVALWTSRSEFQSDSAWKPEYPGISASPAEVNVRLGYAAVSPAALYFALISFCVLIYLCVSFFR